MLYTEVPAADQSRSASPPEGATARRPPAPPTPDRTPGIMAATAYLAARELRSGQRLLTAAGILLLSAIAIYGAAIVPLALEKARWDAAWHETLGGMD